MKNEKKSPLQEAQDKTQATLNKLNEYIKVLGIYTNSLYTALTDIQEIFDEIRNVPSEKKWQCQEVKQIRLNWKQQVEKIEKGFNEAVAKNAGAGAAGAGLGIAVAAMGPTVAMGIATTFGVASTGTAISALSGAAATNAALAWLGGGALAAGGGGMAAGNAFLALAGPVGWGIAAFALVTSGVIFAKQINDQNRIKEIFTLISKRDENSYKLAIVELDERISRIINESKKLNSAVEKIKSYGFDYNKMSEAQQYELGYYVNLMLSSTQLLVNPITNLQPKYSEVDYEEFIASRKENIHDEFCKEQKPLIISLANLLYKIDLNDNDKNLLWNSLKNNKEFLESMNVPEKCFSRKSVDVTVKALDYKLTSQ